MKRLNTLLIIIVSLVIVSCKDSRPILGGEIPFIVTKIERYDETHSEYYCATWLNKEQPPSSKSGGLGYGSASIILPTGDFSIGDTIPAPIPKHLQ